MGIGILLAMAGSADVAQLVEQQFCKLHVAGSIPAIGSWWDNPTAALLRLVDRRILFTLLSEADRTRNVCQGWPEV